MEYLSKRILQKPNALSIENVQTDESYITEANDLFYREDQTSMSRWVSWTMGLILILCSLIGLKLPTGKLMFMVVFIIPGIISIIYGFFTPKKHLTMDRLNNKITVPREYKSSIIILFETGLGVIKYRNTSPGIIGGYLVLQSSKKKPRVEGELSISHNENSNYWAFTVWYMDKNRPLPPGTAFDPYRQKDFERRKAEGFPIPLYDASIETPEATPEQQAERLMIGGW